MKIVFSRQVVFMREFPIVASERIEFPEESSTNDADDEDEADDETVESTPKQKSPSSRKKSATDVPDEGVQNSYYCSIMVCKTKKST